MLLKGRSAHTLPQLRPRQEPMKKQTRDAPIGAPHASAVFEKNLAGLSWPQKRSFGATLPCSCRARTLSGNPSCKLLSSLAICVRERTS